MAQDQTLNTILKKMWWIKEQLDAGQYITLEDVDFWNGHLNEIQDYYSKNAIIWLRKENI